MSEADEVWAALDLGEDDQVVEATLIAKVVNFKKGGPPNISISSTDGLDWIQQGGLLHAAIELLTSEGFRRPGEDG